MPTSAIASSFPFASGELVHEDGQYLGRNRETGGAVILDPRRYGSGHMVIVAPSGGGKSFFVRTLIPQVLLDDDVDVHIIDPSPPIDYAALTSLLGGTYAIFGSGSQAAINPCEIFMPRVKGSLEEEMPKPVTAKVSFLLKLLETMTGAMRPEEKALLEEACYNAYRAKGFSDSWEGVLDTERGGLRPLAKRPPTLFDVLHEAEEQEGLRDFCLRFRPYVKGTLDMFSGESNLALDGRMTVYNVNRIVQGNPDLQPAAYLMITEAIHAAMAASNRKKLILIDEAHVLFQNEQTALFMSQLYRMARKTGSRVGLITQSIVDLIGDPPTGVKVAGAEHARVCLQQASIQLLLHNDKDNDLDLVNATWKLSPAERRFLKSASVGDGLLIAGSDRMLLHVEAPEALYPFITSNPDEWERLQGVRDELTAQWVGEEAQRATATM